MSDSEEKEGRAKPFNWGKEVELTEREPRNVDLDEPAWLSGKQDPEQAGSRQKQVLILTLCVGGLAGIPLAIGSFWSLNKANPSPSALQSPPSADINSYKNLPVPDSTLYDLPPLTVAKNFAFTSDLEERLKWVRHPEEVSKRLSQYPPDAREAIAHQIIPQKNITANNTQYSTFLAKLPDGGQRFLCVIGTPDGPRVDWDAYARYGTASWIEILEGKVTEATVRIFPQPSDHYIRNFQDREKWLAFALASPDLDIPIYGYVDKTSAFFAEVNAKISMGSLRATVDVKISPDDAQHRQVEIVGIRTLGWVEP